MRNPPTGAPFHLDEVDACDKYYSSEFEKTIEDCDNRIARNWLSSEDYIDPVEHTNSRIRWATAGGVFTIVCGCLSAAVAADEPVAAVVPLAFTLMGVGLLTAGVKQMSRPEEAFAKFEESMRTMIPSCVEADLTLKECVKIKKETYGSLEHGYLRG